MPAPNATPGGSAAHPSAPRSRRFWIFAVILTAIFALSGAAFYFGLLFPDFWQQWQRERLARQVWEALQAEQRREAQDPYGGKTPQEVYQLFLQALEKQDIDLAVKYFAFEKQEEVRGFLVDVQKNGNWTHMYDDFSGKTASIEYDAQEGGEQDIKIRALNYDAAKSTGLKAVIRAKKNPNSNLWKLTEFW
jgi:hypothetical protein